MVSANDDLSIDGQVAEKAKQGTCLHCSESAAYGRRGLCEGHYQKFRRAKMALPKSKRSEMDSLHVREGRILAPGAIREIKDPNPFA
jgi:hypothetical protein